MRLERDAGEEEEWKDLRCQCVAEDRLLASLNCFLTASQRLNDTFLDHVIALAHDQHNSPSAAGHVTTATAMQHTERILSYGTRVPGDVGWYIHICIIYISDKSLSRFRSDFFLKKL